jgi:hypothetical protein
MKGRDVFYVAAIGEVQVPYGAEALHILDHQAVREIELLNRASSEARYVLQSFARSQRDGVDAVQLTLFNNGGQCGNSKLNG